MKQRVAIARAMATEPDILHMDEPFAALDALTRERMQAQLPQLWDESRLTVILFGLFVENIVFTTIKAKTVQRWGMAS